MTFDRNQVGAFCAGLIIMISAGAFEYFSNKPIVYKSDPPPPVEEDPSILEAPDPVEVATTTATSTTPEPTERVLPPGVNCLEDCPLIVPDDVLNDGVEEAVRLYFKDIPVMVEIARCESTFKQWDPRTGDVLMNFEGSSATGVLQLMASYHARPAEKMGLDIRELQGNLSFGRHLYETQGTTPWDASKNCWGSANMAINKGISDDDDPSPTLAYIP